MGITEIEAEVKEYSDLLVLEANRYRDKTWEEKLREVEELEKVLKPKAEERMKAGKVLDSFIFLCMECGERFDREVWHCPQCNHHWPMWDIECGNCHKYQRRKNAKPSTEKDPDQKSEQGRTLPKVAQFLGTSHDTLYKIKVIIKEKPELLKAIDEGKRTIHSALFC